MIFGITHFAGEILAHLTGLEIFGGGDRSCIGDGVESRQSNSSSLFIIQTK